MPWRIRLNISNIFSEPQFNLKQIEVTPNEKENLELPMG